MSRAIEAVLLPVAALAITAVCAIAVGLLLLQLHAVGGVYAPVAAALVLVLIVIGVAAVASRGGSQTPAAGSH